MGLVGGVVVVSAVAPFGVGDGGGVVVRCGVCADMGVPARALLRCPMRCAAHLPLYKASVVIMRKALQCRTPAQQRLTEGLRVDVAEPHPDAMRGERLMPHGPAPLF